MVDYMAEFAMAPAAAPGRLHAARGGRGLPGRRPASYAAGDHVTFDLSSLAFSTAADLKDAEVDGLAGRHVLGTFPVDNTIGTAIFDEYGTASVDVVLPAGTPGGEQTLTVTGLRPARSSGCRSR